MSIEKVNNTLTSTASLNEIKGLVENLNQSETMQDVNSYYICDPCGVAPH